jgi:Chloroplast import apparatus Tic20-like
MSWRGTVTVPDRLWSALPYILPIAGSLAFAGALATLLPVTALLLMPLTVIAAPYFIVIGVVSTVGLSPQLAEFAIFMALFFLVVRNPKIPHFIRYNTMQAMMIEIMMTLVSLVFRTVDLSVEMLTQRGLTDPLGVVVLIFFAMVFITAVAAYSYSLFNVAQGKYAEIKWVSEAAYAQTQV